MDVTEHKRGDPIVTFNRLVIVTITKPSVMQWIIFWNRFNLFFLDGVGPQKALIIGYDFLFCFGFLS